MSVGDQVNVLVGLSVGWAEGGMATSSILHWVSAQHTSPFSHSSFEPLGHHLGRPLPVQLAEAAVQEAPQNLKFLGSA